MKNKLLLVGIGLVVIAVGHYLWTAKTTTTEDLPYSEAGEVVVKLLADEPKNINAEGTIIEYMTYGRYLVLGDDEKAKLRGWIVEGPESGGVPPSNANEVTTYPHQYEIGQRIVFSGELQSGLSWCGKDAQESVLEAEVETTPITDQQCFGWVDADKVELAESPAFKDEATIDSRQIQKASELKAEQNKKFEEYIVLMAGFPKDDLHIPNQPYGLDNAILAVKNWRDRVSSYVESKCMAEISTAGGASGHNGLKADCEISIYQSDIDFLNQRIKAFQEHSANIENLIKTGVINKNTSY